MDRELEQILAQCLADMERGAGLEDCLRRHSERAAELGPHLDTWASLGGLAVVQPPTTAFDRGRAAMHGALKAPVAFGPFAVARLAPAWATIAAAAAAIIILLGGAAGASAALGGPKVAGDVLSVVGVNDNGADSDGVQDTGVGACPSPTAEATPTATPSVEDATGSDEEFCDANRGHGNDPDHDDEDNPGQGQGNHGADDPGNGTSDNDGEDLDRGHGNDPDNDDEDNPGQGQGNHGTGNDGNAGGNSDGGTESSANQDNASANGNGPNEPQGQGNGPTKD